MSQIFEGLSAASDAARQATRSRAAVATEGAAERSGTGPFDKLTLDTHINIFSRVNLQDKLTLCIAVCKAWRSFRAQPDLWREIKILETRPMFINGRGLGRLLDWLPGTVIEKLSISVQDKHNDKMIDTASICSAMKNLRGWRGGLGAKQKDLDPSALTTLTLSSRRVGGTVMKTVGVLFGDGLQELDVSEYGCRKLKAEDLLKVLPSMPRLNKLRLHSLDHSAIVRIAATLSQARGGGVPMLTELSACENPWWIDNYAVYPDTVLGAGKLFPEIEVLRLRGMAPLVAIRQFDGQDWELNVVYRHFSLNKETSCLPRLRTVDIGWMTIESDVLNHSRLRTDAGDAVATFVSTVLSVPRQLETARFEVRKRSALSRARARAHVCSRPPHLPCLSAFLPATFLHALEGDISNVPCNDSWSQRELTARPGLSALDANAANLETLKLEGFDCTVETFSKLNTPKLRKLVFSAQDWENVKSQVHVLFPRAEIVRANFSRA